MDLLRQIAQQFARIFKGMTAGQRMSMTLLTLTVVVSIVLLVVWSKTTQYAPLFTDISAEQANEVIGQLEQMGEDYRYRGRRIEVRPERRDIIFARLTEAEALPQVKDLFGWLYTDTPLAETKGRRDLKVLDTVQKKLQIMIGHFNSIRSATVVIARPKETPFMRKEEEEAKASVSVQLASGVSMLPSSKVRAVTQLVAGAVEGLKPENVSVVDQNMRLYRLPGEEEGTFLAANQLDLKRQVEKYYQDKILTVLAFLSPPGSPPLAAVVDVKLDFDRIEKEIKEIDPDTVVTTHEKTTELSEETSGTEGAPPGVGANVELELGATGTGESSTKTQEEREVTREFSSTVSRIIQTPGDIEDISVSVAIAAEVQEDGSMPASAPSDADIDKYKRLVMGAVGITDTEKVEVSTVPFRKVVEPTPSPVPITARIFAALSERASEWARYAGVLILILVGLLMLRSVLKKAVAGGAKPPAVAAMAAGLPPAPEATDVDRMREQLVDMVDESPDVAADLIKRWLMTE